MAERCAEGRTIRLDLYNKYNNPECSRTKNNKSKLNRIKEYNMQYTSNKSADLWADKFVVAANPFHARVFIKARKHTKNTLDESKTWTYHMHVGSSARQGGGAPPGRTGCRQNVSPKRRASLLPSKASKTQKQTLLE